MQRGPLHCTASARQESAAVPPTEHQEEAVVSATQRCWQPDSFEICTVSTHTCMGACCWRLVEGLFKCGDDVLPIAH
jgi:hypothetical protein